MSLLLQEGSRFSGGISKARFQGDNPVEKLSKGENPKANPGRHPYRENMHGRKP
jgi:hypothetical protein